MTKSLAPLDIFRQNCGLKSYCPFRVRSKTLSSSSSSNGRYPPRSRKRMTPTDQTSHLTSYAGHRSRISGAKYPGVPHNVRHPFFFPTDLANPKSANLTGNRSFGSCATNGEWWRDTNAIQTNCGIPQMTYRQQQIFWFQISMCHSFGVHIFQCTQDTSTACPCFLFAISLFLDDPVKEFPTGHELSDEITIVFFLKYFVQLYDVGSLTDFFKIFNLVL